MTATDTLLAILGLSVLAIVILLFANSASLPIVWLILECISVPTGSAYAICRAIERNRVGGE